MTALEDMTGTRLSFHCWPSSKLEATRSVAPFGALYTPLKKLPPQCAPPTALPYDPIRCNCGCVLNPYCQVDFRSKLWVCPFCLTRNHFPPHYADNITEQNLPAELIPQYVTVEYEVQTIPLQGPPAFLFVIDCCCGKEELAELADSLSQALNLLPPECLVGLITFGTNVSVYELASESIAKSYIFRYVHKSQVIDTVGHHHCRHEYLMFVFVAVPWFSFLVRNTAEIASTHLPVLENC